MIRKDLTDKQFGRLKVISHAGVKNYRNYWKCQCECGNTKNITTSSLVNGNTKSCGCLQSDIRTKMNLERLEDLVGYRFGRLLVVRLIQKKNKPFWECVCDCGKSTSVKSSVLKNGATKSCGCLKKDAILKIFTTHGKTGSPIFETYYRMIQRCENPKNKNYIDYGGRGIYICDRWRKENGFLNFCNDMGIKPIGLTLERIDNNGPYCKENCRWATQKEQNNNQRTNRLITYKGIIRNITQWAEFLNINRETLNDRIINKWSIKDALETPVRTKIKNKI